MRAPPKAAGGGSWAKGAMLADQDTGVRLANRAGHEVTQWVLARQTMPWI